MQHYRGKILSTLAINSNKYLKKKQQISLESLAPVQQIDDAIPTLVHESACVDVTVEPSCSSDDSPPSTEGSQSGNTTKGDDEADEVIFETIGY